MSLQTNGFILALRNIGRNLGINKWIASRFISKSGKYEARYDDAFLAEIREKDTVWDVGANIGYYTKKFVDKVGTDGSVIAFEPSPINFEILVEECRDLETVKIKNCALGQQKGTLRFQQGADDIGATSRIVAEDMEGIDVEVCSGQELINASTLSIPNVLKVDVEGFELEVLEGMGSYLEAQELRVLGIEVHFSLLKERGLSGAPKQIETMLIDAGFNVSWPDNSHLLAVRCS